MPQQYTLSTLFTFGEKKLIPGHVKWYPVGHNKSLDLAVELENGDSSCVTGDPWMRTQFIEYLQSGNRNQIHSLVDEANFKHIDDEQADSITKVVIAARYGFLQDHEDGSGTRVKRIDHLCVYTGDGEDVAYEYASRAILWLSEKFQTGDNNVSVRIAINEADSRWVNLLKIHGFTVFNKTASDAGDTFLNMTLEN